MAALLTESSEFELSEELGLKGTSSARLRVRVLSTLLAIPFPSSRERALPSKKATGIREGKGQKVLLYSLSIYIGCTVSCQV